MNKMMNPEIEVVRFGTEDVIATSLDPTMFITASAVDSDVYFLKMWYGSSIDAGEGVGNLTFARIPWGTGNYQAWRYPDGHPEDSDWTAAEGIKFGSLGITEAEADGWLQSTGAYEAAVASAGSWIKFSNGTWSN